ncbi:ligand-dependent nuclear receptor-interacting factor 1, partial [Callorhinchus milii]|uniref:ligand-dependent nuclear receptor-interacting factor 1 n=1 Tax=Callorhinchus milii TaxID=7868 RepID=UPI001C3F7145
RAGRRRARSDGWRLKAVSVAGCIYRIFQMIGPDGKNLLKLIPLSNASGNLLPNLPVSTNNDPSKVNISTLIHVSAQPQITASNSPCLPVFQDTNSGSFFLSPLEGSARCTGISTYSSPATPVPVQCYSTPSAVASVSPAQKSQISSTINVNQKLYMLVKSPMLPSGHHLQIPENAEVKSVPASSLPLALQQKIQGTAASILSSSKESTKESATVIYVSPVNTVKTVQKRLPTIRPKTIVQVANPESIATTINSSSKHGQGSATPPVIVSAASVVSTEQSQFRDAPMKWIVKENPQSLAHYLIPVKSSNNLASKILKSLAEQQHAESTNWLPPSTTASTEINTNIIGCKENALVMYNDKLYLVIQKDNEPATLLTKSGTHNPSIGHSDQADLIAKIKKTDNDHDRTAATVENITKHHSAWNKSIATHKHTGEMSGTSVPEPTMTDAELLMKAGIHTNVRICLTRVSMKYFEQLKTQSTAWAEPLQMTPHPAENMGMENKFQHNIKIEPELLSAVNDKQTQVDLKRAISIKTEHSTVLQACLEKEKKVEIKLEPKSPLKRKRTSDKSPLKVKQFIANQDLEHGYTDPQAFSARKTLHIRFQSTHIPMTSLLKCTLEERSMMKSSHTTNFNIVADCVPSTSGLSMVHAAAAEINAETSYRSVPFCESETLRDERIRRLKEILKEKEAALEKIRRKMIKPKSPVKRKEESNKCTLKMRNLFSQSLVGSGVSECDGSYLAGHSTGKALQGIPGGSEIHTTVSENRCICESTETRKSSHTTESIPKTMCLSAAQRSTAEKGTIDNWHPITSSNGDETMRDEKIKHLKEVLKEKVATLEKIRGK